MRVLLYIIFIFFFILVSLENIIRFILILSKKSVSISKNWYIRQQSHITTIIAEMLSSLYHTLNIRSKLVVKNVHVGLKKRLRKRKKKKNEIPFLFSFRTKIKYFFFGTVFSALFLFLPLALIIFIQELPSPHELSIRQIPQTTKIFDRNGILLTEIYSSQNRTLVDLADVPKHLQQATLAIEDKNFYKHPGFDIPSIMRAFRESVLNQNIQGGSTITQQLIKSSMLTPEQKMSRKIKELVLAFWAERMYTKNQILEMYFNQVPYGGTAWGVEAAAETYFNKSVKELTLAESAFLAGLTAAPTTYSPYGDHPTAWKKRQKEVLNRMVDLNFISQKQADKAIKETLTFRKPQRAIHAPHFVNYMKDFLIQKYGLAAVEKGGLQVRTSLDLKIQQNAEKIVKEEVEKAIHLNLSNGAAVVTNPKNGDILAMVGSKNFYDENGGNVNIATSLRQPGSTIKVVTYIAALLNGFTAASILDDTLTTFSVPGGEPYSPVNYDGTYRGPVSLRFALANSLNLPAVKILSTVTVPAMVHLAEKMGIDTWSDPKNYGLSLTLGAAEVTMLDMAELNGVLANRGKLIEVNPIVKITDAKGTILEEKQSMEGQQVLDEGVTFIISDILADNQARSAAFGTNSTLHIPGHQVSVKTGTSDNKRDNWTNGYTNNYVTVVWVGNNDNSPMSQTLASGITGAAPIWHRIMTSLLTKNPEQKLRQPKNVVKKVCFGKEEYFLKGTESTVNCGVRPIPSAAYSIGRNEQDEF